VDVPDGRSDASADGSTGGHAVGYGGSVDFRARVGVAVMAGVVGCAAAPPDIPHATTVSLSGSTSGEASSTSDASVTGGSTSGSSESGLDGGSSTSVGVGTTGPTFETTSGTTDQPGTSTGGPPAVCEPEPDDGQCAMCFKTYCCEALVSCESDGACTCMRDCLQPGADPGTCATNCGVILDDPATTAGATTLCVSNQCGSGCLPQL